MKFITGLVIGLLLGAAITSAVANPSYIGENAIWNKIFDSTTNQIRIIGQ